MLNFFTRYFFPNEIVIKKGSLQRLKFLKLKNPLLFHSNSAESNGFVEKIKTMFPEIEPFKINSNEPKLDELKKLKDFSKYDEFIAIGGGSVIDTAKLLLAKRKQMLIEAWVNSSKNKKYTDFLCFPFSNDYLNQSLRIKD